MKSKIIRLKDYKEISFEKEVQILPLSGAEIQKILNVMAKKRKRTICPEILEKGDIIVLSVISDDPKFNRKNVPVTLGIGLYSKELEDQIVGMRSGETKSCSVGGTKVQVTVVSASRNVYPEPNDEEVRAYLKQQEYEASCETLEEYVEFMKEKHIQDQKDSAIYGALDNMLNELISESDFSLDEEELSSEVEQETERFCLELKEESGKTPEEMTDEEIRAMCGISSLSEAKDYICSSIETRVKVALVMSAIRGIEPEDDAAYDYAILEDYIRSEIHFREVSE